MNIGRGEIFEYYKYSINLLTRFNKTREKFPSVTRVLSILLATEAASVSVENADSKEHVALWLATCFRKPKVPGSRPAASYAHK